MDVGRGGQRMPWGWHARCTGLRCFALLRRCYSPQHGYGNCIIEDEEAMNSVLVLKPWYALFDLWVANDHSRGPCNCVIGREYSEVQ